MEAIAPLLRSYPTKHYDKGQIILCQDAEPQACYIIQSGFVKTYTITAEGDEKPVSFDTKFDVFPVAWAFGKAMVADCYHQAYTDCELYQVPRDDFLGYIQTKPKIVYRFMHYMLDRCLDYQAHVRSLEQAKAADKILHALNFLTHRFGKKVARSRVRMMLPLTQQDLANFLGLTRETTGTQLKQLQRKGVIDYHQQKYLVHQDKLDDLLDQK